MTFDNTGDGISPLYPLPVPKRIIFTQKTSGLEGPDVNRQGT